MAGQGTATKPASIDNAFAATERQLRANKPFSGAISRIRNGQQVILDYVKKQDRLTLQKWLDQKDISQGQFLLETQNQDGQDITIEFMVDKNADSPAVNPFFQDMPGQPRQNGTGSALKEQLEAEIVRLSGEMETVKSKRREAEEELYKFKRENSDDNTELKNAHRDEKDRIKENHRKEVDALKEEIRQKDWEIKLKEIELMNENGSPSGWDKVIDKFLDDDVLSNVAAQLGKLMQKQGNAQPTAQQIQAAYQQAGNPQLDAENGAQSATASEASARRAQKNPDQEQQEQAESSQPEPEPKSEPESQPQPQLTPEQVKAQIADGLKNLAIQVLTDKNANLAKYANAVQQQLAINKKNGITLDAGQWVLIAKALSEKAVKEEINAERVAKVIEPALAGLPDSYRFMLSAIDANAAAKQLFNAFNIEASAAVKQVVVKVLQALKNS